MKRDEHNIPKLLDRHLGRYGEPSREHMDSAVERVRQQLNPDISQMTNPLALESHARNNRLFPLAAAAAVLAIVGSVVLVRTPISQKSASIIAELSDGKLTQTGQIHPNERLQSGANGAVITLADGSRVEVRAQSELTFERADDGVRIRLYKGGVIVNAAKQRAGHLYVQTKDVTVSVVGTVFLVNAEEEGSRVAVIQGEVEVHEVEAQQDVRAKKLIPGQQVATNPLMELRPVSEEISWSRHAEEHLALLKLAAVPEAVMGPPTQRLDFSVVSIKPIPPHGTLDIVSNGGSIGLACHGTDGMPRAPFGGGAGPITVAQGRCLGVAVDVAWLINYAYETPWRYGPNVPDWARSGDRPNQSDLFQIEAAAEDPATATTAQLRQMLQAMLADRFKLKIHRETQDVLGYSLVIAKGGPRLKPTDELDPPHFGPGIRGKSSLDELAQYLTQFVIAFSNLGSLDGPFVNKTGLTGNYDYAFRLSGAGVGIRGETPGGPPPTRLERRTTTIEGISAGMEAELGIRLQPEKMPADVIVVDQVERPAPN